jgi:hypothetical protein
MAEPRRGRAPLQDEVGERTAEERDDAHQERRSKPMPDREVVIGQGAADDRARGGGEHAPNGQRGGGADDEAGEDEQLDGDPHPLHRLMGCAREVACGRSEEDVDREPERVGDATRAGDRRGDGQRPLARPRCRSTNQSRASRNTPSFTIVAEWRYAPKPGWARPSRVEARTGTAPARSW